MKRQLCEKFLKTVAKKKYKVNTATVVAFMILGFAGLSTVSYADTTNKTTSTTPAVTLTTTTTTPTATGTTALPVATTTNTTATTPAGVLTTTTTPVGEPTAMPDLPVTITRATSVKGEAQWGGIANSYNTIAIGQGSIAGGQTGTTVGPGIGAVAIGIDAVAPRKDSVAIGNGAEAATSDLNGDMQGAVAIGGNAKASTSKSVAIGQNAETVSAIGSSVAVGADSKATQNAIALGANSDAKGAFTIAAGKQAEAAGNHSISMGTETRTNGGAGTTIGAYATTAANGIYKGKLWSNGVTVGYGAKNLGSYSSVVGVGASSVDKKYQGLTTPKGDAIPELVKEFEKYLDKEKELADLYKNRKDATSTQDKNKIQKEINAKEKEIKDLQKKQNYNYVSGNNVKEYEKAVQPKLDALKADIAEINKQITDKEIEKKSLTDDKKKQAIDNQIKALIGKRSPLEEKVTLTEGKFVKVGDKDEYYDIQTSSYGLNTVFGAYSSIEGNSSSVMGYSAKVNANKAIAIGRNANTDIDNSVAIGVNAKTDAAIDTKNSVIGGVTFQTFRGTTDQGGISAFSVGNENYVNSRGDAVAEFNRQIQNVAAGRITEGSTDAVNGSQAYALTKGILDNSPLDYGVVTPDGEDGKLADVTKIGDKYYIVSPEGKPVYVTKEGNDKVVIGNDGKEYVLDGGKYYPAKADGTKDDTAIGIPEGAFDGKRKEAEGTIIAKLKGKEPQVIGNVADGTHDNEAVNVKQLNAVRDASPFEYAIDNGNGNYDNNVVKVGKGNDAKFYVPDAKGKIVAKDGTEYVVVGDKLYNVQDIDKLGNPIKGAKDAIETNVDFGDKVVEAKKVIAKAKTKEPMKLANIKSSLDKKATATETIEALGKLNPEDKADNAKLNSGATLGDLKTLATAVDENNPFEFKVQDANGNPTDEKFVKVGKDFYTPDADGKIADKDGTKYVIVGDKLYKDTDIENGKPKAGAKDAAAAKVDFGGNKVTEKMIVQIKSAEPVQVGNIASALNPNGDIGTNYNSGDKDKIKKAITDSQNLINGNPKDANSKGLTQLVDGNAADKVKLDSGATVRDLQALAIGGMTFAGEEKEVHRALGSTLKISGGAGTTALTNGNIGVVVNTEKGKEGLEVKLAQDLKGMKSIEFAKTDAAGNAVAKAQDGKYYLASEIKDGTPKAGAKEIAAEQLSGTGKITGLADGTNPTDAVTVKQLNEITGNLSVKKIKGGAGISVDQEDLQAGDVTISLAADTKKLEFIAQDDKGNKVVQDPTTKKWYVADNGGNPLKTKEVAADKVKELLTVKTTEIVKGTGDNAGKYVVADKDALVTGQEVADKLNDVKDTQDKWNKAQELTNAALGKDIADNTRTIAANKDAQDNWNRAQELTNVSLNDKIENKEIVYRANGSTKPKAVNLSKGLDFTNGVNTTAVVEDNGVVKYNLNSDLTGMKSIEFGKTDAAGNAVAKAQDGKYYVATEIGENGKPKAGAKAIAADDVVGTGKITGLAEGTESSDAVNVKQLKEILAQAGLGGSSELEDGTEKKIVARPIGDEVDRNTQNIANNGRRIDELNHRVNRTAALSAAMAGLHALEYKEERPNQVMAGLGFYRESQAVAVGLAHHFDEDFMISGSVAASTESRHPELMANLGFSLRLGDDDKDRRNENLAKQDGKQLASVYMLQNEVTQLKSEKQNEIKKNNEQAEEIKDLKARLEKLESLLLQK